MHQANVNIAEAQEDKAKEQLSEILMREPTADEIINWINE